MAIHTHFSTDLARWSMVAAFALAFVGCGGGGSSNPPGPAPATVTVSGKITFDRIPFDTTPDNGLNPNAPIESPARGVVVEAISGAMAIAATTTNSTGDYVLTVPSNTQLFIRAKAQMLKSAAAPTWDFQVLNNTNSDALYALDGSTFNSGVAASTRNLRAASGWGTTSYTGVRAAAPFAILDTVYSATTLITSASPTAVFEPLDLYWSPDNRSGTRLNNRAYLCIDSGDIQTTFYTTGGGTDDCAGRLLAGIYVLGAFEEGTNGSGGDTDEFDQHIIAHEFGHYVEVEFSRADSIGGEHADGDKLDMRVAFGEGWGNAFSGMVLSDPIYRDSFSGVSDDFRVNMEVDDSRFAEGWFSETSVQEILWDVFDSTNEPGDSLALGFTPIFNALAGEQRTTEALTTIFSFLAALESASPNSVAGINQLRNGENIDDTDEFGVGEDNAGGDPSVLPIYRPITLNGGQQVVCVRASNGDVNKLGFAKFFRLDLATAAIVTINVIGTADPGTPLSTAAQDPDIYVYRRGAIIASGRSDNPSSETISQEPLISGTHIIEVYDYLLSGGNIPRCMTISVTGN